MGRPICTCPLALSRRQAAAERPSVEEHGGYGGLHQTLDLHGLSVDVRGETPVRIADAGIRVLLFQVVRELLFNVVKHSNVAGATLSLGERDGDPVIGVADGGVGAEADKLAGGFGLRSVREQVELLGGELTVLSERGEGTRVTVRVPGELTALRSKPRAE